MAPAELKSGQMYFKVLTAALGFVVVFTFFYQLTGFVLALFPALAVGSKLWRIPLNSFVGIGFGAALAVSKSFDWLGIIAVAIFLYGLSAGALIEDKHWFRCASFAGFLLASALAPIVIMFSII